MTQNQKFYVEQIINYLNLLAEDTIFTQEWRNMYGDEHHNEVTIRAKNTAYLTELHQLVDLLDMMHPHSDKQEPETTIH
ncbi:MAG: hypothetical protein IKU98_08095 [Bacteroidaceae bacterium]|nr:hypothetical protein [Bacteroidaceae bacterium]